MEINQEWIAQQRAICDAATPGPWEADEYGGMVWAKNPYGHDLMRVADIRGWGHLTGSGACALPQTQAQGIQNANQVFIAAARTALPAALDALEASIQREAEKDATIARLTAERDAAARDLKWLSNEYKFCVTCKRDNGRGVWDCNDERCNAENHYEWRGLRSSNTDAPTGAESEADHAE